MQQFLVAAGLSILIGTSALAQTVNDPAASSGMRSNAASIPPNKQKLKKPHKQATVHVASPSGNPGYDVYVRGEYVGSDPDPRIRATIRREATRDYGWH
jgi:hypothetical protein